MSVDVDLGDVDDSDDVSTSNDGRDPDDFLLKSAFRVVYQTNNFLLPQIRDMIERREAINLHPEYQRRLRWSSVQKSRLIESLLLNIPIPPVFFYESDAARYEVMDGQQRLNAIKEFFTGAFALTGLRVLSPLNGIRYPKAPPRVKRTLDRASISAIVLLLESESEKDTGGADTVADIRRLVFDRLNTGGMKLNPQELRNAQNPGELNDVIIRLSRFSLFTTVFGIPPYIEDPQDYYVNPERQKNSLYSSMKDCELILRYFALKDAKNIRGSIRSMLDRAMEVKLSKEQAEKEEEIYKKQFALLFDLYDEFPFRLNASSYNDKERVSAAVYDSSMVALDRNWDKREKIKASKQKVQERMEKALSDPSEYEILVGRGNTAESVRSRIELMEKILLTD